MESEKRRVSSSILVNASDNMADLYIFKSLLTLCEAFHFNATTEILPSI